MKFSSLLLSGLLLLAACGNNSSKDKKEPVSFFPITSYLKGQINEIKKEQKNALKKWTIDQKTDSIWLKPEELEAALNDFITPVIDSLHYANYFVENNFVDQTQNAVTLLYEPVGEIPKEIPWLQWTIYVSPNTNQVSKVYMVKRINDQQTQQLTWKVQEKNCMSRTIVTNPNKDSSFVSNETSIYWNY